MDRAAERGSGFRGDVQDRRALAAREPGALAPQRRGEGLAARGFALFDAPIGRCAIVWSARGIAGLLLPEAREAETRGRLARRFPEAREAVPPPAIHAAIAALLAAAPSDVSALALDMAEVPPFHRRVYEELRAVPPGETLSYGALAARAGAPG